MQHRGPDDFGDWWSSARDVGLGHRRLAIVDLSRAGHQPMQNDSGDLCIVFNGEIYNFSDLRGVLAGQGHVFRSNSDTEVILAAYREWGRDCLKRLSGMFAFALYDQRARRLLLARDRAGEKPLFYALSRGELRFSSELKGLLADPSFPRAIDTSALDCYLTMGFVPAPACILQGVRKLPAAHALEFDLGSGQAQVFRYWELPEPPVDTPDETALLDQLEHLLADAVRRQLVADVPVGVLLSGGMDSSLVTAMAVRNSQRVKTFTIRFPGYGQYDETGHARLISQHFGTEHVELDATDSAVDLLPRLAAQFDEPIVDSSMIPTFAVSKLIREHCTVALGGDGGDELFGGYEHHSRLLRMYRAFRWAPSPLRSVVARAAEALLPIGFRGRNWLQGLEGNLSNGLPLIAQYFDRTSRRRLMSHFDEWPLVGEQIRAQTIPRSLDLLQRATRMDFQTYLAEDVLVKVDRASMLNSLEVRAPLLDHRIVEFAFGTVPSSLKASATERKILLKKLAKRVLPPAFDADRKQGFSIPLAAWLRNGPWSRFFIEVLLESDDTMFDRKQLRKLLDGQRQGRSNSERLFALVMFELWRRAYRV